MPADGLVQIKIQIMFIVILVQSEVQKSKQIHTLLHISFTNLSDTTQNTSTK